MDRNNSCPITTEIKNAEDTIKSCYDRVEALEKKLKSYIILAPERKAVLENELKEFKKLIASNEVQLSKLHKENSKSFAVAAILLFICFLVYGLYAMYFGNF